MFSRRLLTGTRQKIPPSSLYDLKSLLCLEYWFTQWHCDVHSLNLPSTGVVMTKEHVLGTNVQNQNSRTPPIIMAPRGRWLKGNVRKIGEMQIVPGSLLFWGFRQNDHHLCACECVCVRHPLNLDLCDSNMTFRAHCGSQMMLGLCSAICLDVIYCFSLIEKNYSMSRYGCSVSREIRAVLHSILMFMHLKLCKCCN